MRLSAAVAGVTVVPLVATSKDSYVRPLNPTAPAAALPAPAAGPQLIAAAAGGSWPGAAAKDSFRLVLAGNAGFAANAFFPYASNGDLAVSMIRWLTADTTTPLLKPTPYSMPELRLTHRQMQATFLVLVVLLPLGVVLLGAAVWWHRR